MKRENPDPCPNETSALSFAIDEASDRLAVGAKRRVLLLKRVVSALQPARFEHLHTFDIDEVSAHDVCLVVENGQRWICVSSWESTMWISTEQQHLHQLQQQHPKGESKASQGRLTLPSADLLVPGRRQDEVLICRSTVCTFTTPYLERSSITFSDSVWQVVLMNPYLVGCLKNSKIEVRLDDGQVLQTLEGNSVSFRWSVAPFRDSRALLLCGGDFRRRLCYQLALPIQSRVRSLLREGKFSLAVSLSRSLLRRETTWAGSKITGDEVEEDDVRVREAQLEVEQLYSQCKMEYAYALLQTKPSCSVQEIDQVAVLLDAFGTTAWISTSAEQEQDSFRILYLFADTDLFSSPDIAWTDLTFLFPSVASRVKREVSFARFKPGVLCQAVRLVFLPIAFRIREKIVAGGSLQEEDEDGPSDRSEDQIAKLERVDSLLLRAFVLGRPPRNVSKQNSNFELDKKRFLQDNHCSITESERLLLSFPEMWEDHAALLAGKGEFEKGLEWLKTLGSNAPDTDVEKYASASIRMLAERPDLTLDFSRWLLERAPILGVDALVRFKSFSSPLSAATAATSSSLPHRSRLNQIAQAGAEQLQKARLHFQSFPNPQALFKLYLERLVTEREDDCPYQARDELAMIYLEEDDKERFFRLVSAPGRISHELLLSRLDDWPREQAVVLDKASRRKEAAFILATKCSMKEAETYAKAAAPVENVFDTVFDGLLSQGSGNASDSLLFLSRNFDNVDGVRALSHIPDDLPLTSCMDLVRVALAEKSAAHRDRLVVKQLLQRENLLAVERLARSKAGYVVLNADSPLCKVCHRGFKADSPVIVLRLEPYHYACYQQLNPAASASGV